MEAELYIIFTFQFSYVFMYMHQKPVAEKIWQQRCSPNSYVLNDCNWCKCNVNSQYSCKARVCHEIDMFGHFNDAIQDINVGMEGHGIWRSSETACEPGVHYQREDLICVCDDNGNWPNPVCRDSFKVLHQVNIINTTNISSKQRCTPTYYHLIGCNVCYCPSTGRIDPDLCTESLCSDDDPILYKDREVNEVTDELTSIQEVYSECVVGKEYKLGCRTCSCLQNNRLLCNNCSSDNKPLYRVSYCDSKKPGEIFSVDCNVCYCDRKNLMYCTAKKCVSPADEVRLKKQLSFIDKDLESVERPIEDENCSPGTKYKKDCNTCYCVEKDGVKIFGCTMRNCLGKNDIYTDCVSGSTYELDCQICHCTVVNGFKRQMCRVNDRCSNIDATKVPRSIKLSSLHGYCEPLHVYQKDCNQCRCLADGKTTLCTSQICKKQAKAINVEIVPVLQDNLMCPKGHSYKVDCNVCFCLPNGNAICTLQNCKK